MRELYDKIKGKIYIPLIISIIFIVRLSQMPLWLESEEKSFGQFFINYQKLGFCRDGFVGSIVGLVSDDLFVMFIVSCAMMGIAACVLSYMFSIFSWKCTDNLNFKIIYFVLMYVFCTFFFDSQLAGSIIFVSLLGMIMILLVNKDRNLWMVPILSVVATLIDVDYVITFFGIVLFAIMIKTLNERKIKCFVSGGITFIVTEITAWVCNAICVSPIVMQEYLSEIIEKNNKIPENDRFIITEKWFDFYFGQNNCILFLIVPIAVVIITYIIHKFFSTKKEFVVFGVVATVLIAFGLYVDSFWISVIPVFLLYIYSSKESGIKKMVDSLCERFSNLGYTRFIFIADYIIVHEIVFGEMTFAAKIISGLLVCIATFTFVFVKKSSVDYAVKYLILVLPISLATTLFVTPAYYTNSPDEGRHYTRIYSISMGQLLPNSEGEGIVNVNIEPKDELKEYTLVTMIKQFNQEADFDKFEYVNFYGAAIYPFLGYIPQVITLNITKLFTNNVFLLMYGARFGSWILSVWIIYRAIKKTPLYKCTFMLFALTSMIVREMVALNVDGVSFACAMLLLAEILYYCYNKHEKISLKDKVVIFILGAFLALSKTLYAPLILVVFALEKTNFKFEISKNIYVVLTFVGAVSIALLWVASVGGLINGTTEGVGVDGAKQIEYIMSDIVNYFEIMIKTIRINGMTWFHDMFGRNNQRYSISEIAVAVGEIAIFVSVLKEKRILDNKKINGLSIVAGVIIVVCSLTGEYIQFTKVGADTIMGVQGRYFVPVFMFVAIAIGQFFHRIINLKMISDKILKCKEIIAEVSAIGLEYVLFYYYVVISIVSLCSINI